MALQDNTVSQQLLAPFWRKRGKADDEKHFECEQSNNIVSQQEFHCHSHFDSSSDMRIFHHFQAANSNLAPNEPLFGSVFQEDRVFTQQSSVSKRKVKCDRAKPRCEKCREADQTCTMKDVLRKSGPPTKEEKQMLDEAAICFLSRRSGS
ncbi:hypothetical protein FA10DRAFT_263203 [Acaromyces ingoldii]|uniref:Zn(2)-C6 fungal-type domain-containing protein n=1 Tax=Acaromyces ingoldii TaxID=215250 RepID=A0A316YBQ4_9BASI|nr:hypothetical protein FA10DRAFT_263203 [Acaromyces ingoldii]PWN86699.1 hypothetical protein FA10DRAFT_263203 [Acaromyces ingoldii]